MESKGDEASHQPSNRIKPTSHSQFSVTSMQDSSSLAIPTLLPELITEILLRLPVKSLLQFKCVSKSWLALISSQDFIKTHLSLSAKNEDYNHHKLMWRSCSNFKVCSIRSLLCGSVVEASDLEYPYKSFNIVGSANGLICLTDGAYELILWNPTISKYKKLPASRPRLKNTNIFTYGFGFDECHDDYKVVGIFGRYKNGLLEDTQVNIYSLSSDSWRSKDDFPGGLQLLQSGTFVNGKLYWATISGLNLNNGMGTRGIISVDMADENWEKVEQPSCVGEDFGLRLGVLGNYLSILCNSHSHVNLWVMKKYGVKESWAKMYTIKRPIPGKYVVTTPFCMSNKGEILVVFGSTSAIYNTKDDTIKYAEITNFGSCMKSAFYIESLVCPISHQKKQTAEDTVRMEAAKTQMNDDYVPDLGSDGPSLIGSRRSSDDSNNADRVPDLESGNPSIGSRRSSD
ncbi:hypothetical protein EJD97_016224 [Solanum chilense]|uniref:F-box domain-containing protein n=1 Tax=Solanum chilense TaxID=4083 RepID=A0A6N2B7X1_SOLCI|nr:hypothetical protein EJD97_016224 [Solanum chilense]